MKSMKKTIALAVAIAMICGCVVGGTLAWLIATDDPVVNTFTVGNINIELTETFNTDKDANIVGNDAWQGKMIPGSILDKDPTVTVEANSEACWLFVKVQKSANLDTFITYAMADGWNQLANSEGVYYREVAATTTAQSFPVIKYNDAENKVYVKDTVTKSMMDALEVEGAVQPTLTFTAYAVQKDNVADAATAWGYASDAEYNAAGANVPPTTGE